MDIKAIDQAKFRLQRAKSAVARLVAAKTFQESEEAWCDFLIAINGIFSKLEQGAKINGKSEAWYGRKKNQRRKDPALSYLRFARNADEHGIERVTEVSPGSKTAFIKPGFNERAPCWVQNVDQTTFEPTGEKIAAMIAGPCIICVTAEDQRFGDRRDPPSEHLGNLIECPRNPGIEAGKYPDALALAVLPYFSSLIEEAELLI